MISLIVCTYNRDKYIYSCLQKIADNGYPTQDYEIILVNNNSTDNTEQLCRKFGSDYPQVQFRYFNETNQGLSYARNRGIAAAEGDRLGFLDDDAMLHRGSSTNLQSHHD